jgi:hypothetical protein
MRYSRNVVLVLWWSSYRFQEICYISYLPLSPFLSIILSVFSFFPLIFCFSLFPLSLFVAFSLYFPPSFLFPTFSATHSFFPLYFYFLRAERYLCRQNNGLRAGRPRFYSRQRQYYSLFSIASTPVLGPTQPPIQWVPRTFAPGIKRPGHQADHTSPSSAEVKDSGAIPPLPPYVFMKQCPIN